MHQIARWVRDFVTTMTCELNDAQVIGIYEDLAKCFQHEIKVLNQEQANPFVDDDIEAVIYSLPHYTFEQASASFKDSLVIVPATADNKTLFVMSMQLLVCCSLPQSLIGDYMEAHELGTISSCKREDMQRLFQRCSDMLQSALCVFNADPPEWPSWIANCAREALYRENPAHSLLSDDATWPE